MLDLVPNWQLDPMATLLFGGPRPWHYDFSFPETDRKLVALEQYELAQCVRTGAKPEVDGRQGMHALAIVHALFESQVAGRAVSINEIESAQLTTYQDEIDLYYGLIEGGNL